MRILILSQYYAPEPVPKPHELALGLVKRGHQVLSITGFPNYPHGSFYSDRSLRPWRREVQDGVDVLRLPLVPDHSRSAVSRILNYTSFMTSAAVLGSLMCGKADVIYVWHPPLTLGVSAWLMGLSRRIPVVYGVHDLWPEAVEATGMVTNQRVLGMMSKLERFVYKRATAIGVVSPGFKRNLVGKGVPEEKVHILPDCANEAVFHPLPPDATLARDTGMSGRFNVLFGGNLGLAQGLETVIDVAQRLAYVPEVQFVFAGDGMDRARLESLAKERKLDNVLFLGQQPGERMPELYALADVLLAHYRRDPLFEISIPGKVFNYMSCQRPVLMASEGDAADLVAAAGAGVTCPAEDPEALAGAVMQLYNMPPAERAELGAAGRRAVRERYSLEVQARDHEELLLQVAEGRFGVAEPAKRA